jgi:hypothetical protein
MADLSNLLGAVYGEGDAPSRDADAAPVPVEPAAAERGPAVPDGADDEHLDAAFAEWKPGPSDLEHEAVAGTPGPAAPLADDLAAALSEALVAHEDDHDEDEDDGDVQSHLSPQRAAAAELTAASRFGAEPEPVAAPAPVEEPEAETSGASLLASLPYATDERKRAPKVETADEAPVPAPVPVGPRSWERSDDDILPSKGGRGFFSLSLRRG